MQLCPFLKAWGRFFASRGTDLCPESTVPCLQELCQGLEASAAGAGLSELWEAPSHAPPHPGETAAGVEVHGGGGREGRKGGGPCWGRGLVRPEAEGAQRPGGPGRCLAERQDSPGSAPRLQEGLGEGWGRGVV